LPFAGTTAPGTVNSPLDDEPVKLASPEYVALTEKVPGGMVGLTLAAQDAEPAVGAEPAVEVEPVVGVGRAQEYVPLATRKVTEPVGVPPNSEETVAVREFNEIAVVARDTVSVPGTNSNV